MLRNFIRKSIDFKTKLTHYHSRNFAKYNYTSWNFCTDNKSVLKSERKCDEDILKKVDITLEDFNNGVVQAFKTINDPNKRKECFFMKQLTSPGLSALLNDKQDYINRNDVDVYNLVISAVPKILSISVQPGFIHNNNYFFGFFRKIDFIDGMCGPESWSQRIESKIVTTVQIDTEEFHVELSDKSPDIIRYGNHSHIMVLETDICENNNWLIKKLNNWG